MTQVTSYRQILRSTGIIGGTQVFQVLTTILKGKAAAVFLGATGVGVASLLLSSLAMLQAVAGLGLSYSGVREISQAHETGNGSRVGTVAVVLLRWLCVSSTVCGTILLIFADRFSLAAFGDISFSGSFSWLSVAILAGTVAAGYEAVLRGTRKIGSIARASLFSSGCGALFAVPAYWWLGTRGIVLTILFTAFLTLGCNYYFARDLARANRRLGPLATIRAGTGMARLGLVMMIVDAISAAATFAIVAYIKNVRGSLSDVGFYQAGTTLAAQFVGLVFTAMSMDYFPRLAAVCDDNRRVRRLANQQSEMMLHIVRPLILGLIVFAPHVISVLLSRAFLPMVTFVRLASVGMLFQAAAHSMGLISYAKGDRGTFLTLSVIGNGLLVGTSWLGYRMGGLDGLGAMFVLHCVICFAIVYATVRYRYRFRMSRKFRSAFSWSVGWVALSYGAQVVTPCMVGMIIGFLTFLASLCQSLQSIKEAVGVRQFPGISAGPP